MKTDELPRSSCDSTIIKLTFKDGGVRERKYLEEFTLEQTGSIMWCHVSRNGIRLQSFNCDCVDFIEYLPIGVEESKT